MTEHAPYDSPMGRITDTHVETKAHRNTHNTHTTMTVSKICHIGHLPSNGTPRNRSQTLQRVGHRERSYWSLGEIVTFAVLVAVLGYAALIGFFGGGYIVCRILIDNGFGAANCPIW